MLSEEIEEKEPITDNEIFIYPNPTSNSITLSVNDFLFENIHSIKLYNTNAVVIKNITPKKKIQLDLSSYASGVYLLHIQTKEGKSITKKIIKK